MKASRSEIVAPMVAFFRRFGEADVLQITSNRSYHSIRFVIGDRGVSLTVERRDRRIGLFAEERGTHEHAGSWSTSPGAVGRQVHALLPEEPITDPDDPAAIGTYLSRHEAAATKAATTYLSGEQ